MNENEKNVSGLEILESNVKIEVISDDELLSENSNRLLNSVNFQNIKTIKNPNNSKNIQSPKIELINKMALNISHALKIIPLFDGKLTELHRFCSCVEVIWSQIAKEDEKKLFMNILKTKLCGQAYEIVHYRDFATWEDLKLALENKFLKRRSQGAVSAELVCIVQDKNENVKSFASKVELLLYELNDICISKQGLANAEIIKKINESTALNSFQDGLKDNLKIIIKSHHFNNLNDAIAQAIEEEISHKPTSSSYSRYPYVNSNKNNCAYCKKSGHNIDKCYKRNNRNLRYANFNPNYNNNSTILQTSQNSNNDFPQNTYKHFQSKTYQNNSNLHQSMLSCNYCKREGHSISDCYKKRYNDSLKQQSHSNVKIINHPTVSENQEGSGEMNTTIRVQQLQ